MKIFISHSSANKEYGDALVELLRSIAIAQDQIIYTSNPAYGIPLSANIFNWLKAQITEKPFVIYLLSREYYSSIACLNEMGAAWVIENKHAIVFTPGFEISSKEFQNGAIDPREIGFYLDNQERLLTFIQLLEQHFTISSNRVLIQQAVDRFMKSVEAVKHHPVKLAAEEQEDEDSIMQAMEVQEQPKAALAENKLTEVNVTPADRASGRRGKPKNFYEKFLNDLNSGRLNEAELLLLHYIIENGSYKLATGWQEGVQISKIKLWEEVHEQSHKLSNLYPSLVEKFRVRGYTDVSEVTSYGNPKEFKLRDEIAEHILYLPDAEMEIIYRAAEANRKANDDGLPF